MAQKNQNLAGRIARQALLQERGHVRSEEAEIAFEGGAKPRHRKSLGRHFVAEEIAIRPDEVAYARCSVIAIQYVREGVILLESRGEPFAERDEGGRRCSLKGKQHDA